MIIPRVDRVLCHLCPEECSRDLRLIADARRRFTKPLKTRTAKDRPAETGQERNGGGSPALRAVDAGFDASTLLGDFPLALLAMARLMAKALIPEEELLARAENEFLTAIHAFENPVGEFHRFHLALGKALGHPDSIAYEG